jgi:uncharacterized cupredoxin-like copper-binding protein
VIRLLLGIVAALLLAACPGGRPEDSAKNAPSKTSTTTQNPQAVPENSTAMMPMTPPSAAPPPAAPRIAEVQLLEYEIRMADTLSAGPQRLRIANAGKERHSLSIEGPGVSEQLASDLTRGDTTELSLTLQPGVYEVWCPVDEHRGKGMKRTITVK